MIIQLNDCQVPRSLRGPVLIDASGLPRYWAAVWSTAAAGALADSSHLKKLRYLENLYQHADELRGCGALDDALASLDELALGQILESWFVSIRNKPQTTATDETRWQVGFNFVRSVVSWIAKSNSDRALRQIDVRLHQLSVLYSQFRVKKRNAPETIRSLPASVVEALYQLLDPESANNPFPRIRTRWRVYVAFILMLHQGLRRGEVLLLPVDAVKSSYDARLGRVRSWINIRSNDYEDPNEDPRHSKPGIKTQASIRQIPISETTARILQLYADNYRGRVQHSYLLSSKSRLPLSTEALTKAFAVLSAKLPPAVIAELEARTGKTTITPHDLRHTCSVVRLHQMLLQGDPMDEALQKMRTFFGWSRQSTMPTRYARAVFEDRLAGVWNNAFDDRVEMLRAIPGGL
jgi:integrase